MPDSPKQMTQKYVSNYWDLSDKLLESNSTTSHGKISILLIGFTFLYIMQKNLGGKEENRQEKLWVIQ